MYREELYYVYIIQSASRRALYIGMANNLHKRVWQHKNHSFEGFTDDYKPFGLFTGRASTTSAMRLIARRN